MKKTIKYWAFSVAVFALVFTACEKENVEDEANNFYEDVTINMNELGDRVL